MTKQITDTDTSRMSAPTMAAELAETKAQRDAAVAMLQKCHQWFRDGGFYQRADEVAVVLAIAEAGRAQS